jgi:hypothetical protein
VPLPATLHSKLAYDEALLLTPALALWCLLPFLLLCLLGTQMGHLILEPVDIEVITKEELRSYWLHRGAFKDHLHYK